MGVGFLLTFWKVIEIKSNFPRQKYFSIRLLIQSFQFHYMDQEKLKEMYDSGLTIRQIAKEMGLSYSKVRRALIKMGVKLKRRKPLSEEDKKIIELYKEGMSISKISKLLSRNYNSVLRVVKSSPYYKARKKLSEKEKAKIINLFKEGRSIYSIAKEFNISTNLVVYYLRKSKVMEKKRGRRGSIQSS